MLLETPFSNYTELVMVPGHSVYIGLDYTDVESENNWYLLDYQVGKEVPRTIVQHIERAVEITHKNPSALLIFSGGKTRPVGPMTEAQSYWMIARSQNWFGRDVSHRAMTEEFAKDSYENLLFSIARFRELTGRYPQKITVVGFEFKRKRFEDVHLASIRYPKRDFVYVGIGGEMTDGEADTLNAFVKDPQGCKSPLADKKKLRNPYRTEHGYIQSCPELKGLLQFCGKSNFKGDLPWE